MNTIQKAIQSTRHIYGSSLPRRIDTSRFRRFAMTANTLAYKVAPINLQVVDYVNTACYELVRAPSGNLEHTCSLSVQYATSDFYLNMGIPLADVVPAALVLINGSSVHEALHARLTPADNFEDVVKIATQQSALSDSSNDYQYSLCQRAQDIIEDSSLKAQLLSQTINLVEDLFIEAWLFEHFPRVQHHIHYKNAMLFSPYNIDKAYNEVTSEFDRALAIIAAYKNVEARDALTDYPIMDGIVDIVTKMAKENPPIPPIDNPVTVSTDWIEKREIECFTRVSLGVLLFDWLKSLNGFQYIGDSLNIDTTVDANGFENNMLGMMGAYTQLTEKEAANIVLKFDNEALASSQTVIEKQTIYNSVNLIDVLDSELDTAGHDDNTSENFRAFARFLKTSIEDKHAPVTPRDRGTKLLRRHLHRFATDGRVFGRNVDNKKVIGTPEVIVRIDMSASMTWEKIPGRTPGYKLIHEVVYASKGMFKSLQAAGIPVAIYGDTTKWGYDNPILRYIAAFNMPIDGKLKTTHDINKRFYYASRAYNGGNADGNIIHYLGHQFSSRPGQKVLLVMSDGQPSDGGQDNMGPEKYTTYAANKLRERGIHVYSMSLTQEVMEDNDRIYGENNNFAAYGDLLIKQMQKLSIAIAHNSL